MSGAVLTISSKNYGAWALRGWLMARFAGLDFTERVIPPDDPAMKAEMLLLSSSIRVPCLEHDGARVWDTLAIGEYLNEIRPEAALLPADRAVRAHCRAICGEMHSGFSALRSSLPMNIKGHFPKFKLWSRAQADVDRIVAIWTECLQAYAGPYLFGTRPCIDRRCDVRAGGHALPHLRGGTRRALRRLLPHDHGLGSNAGMGGSGPGRTGRDRRAGRRVLNLQGARDAPIGCAPSGSPLHYARCRGARGTGGWHRQGGSRRSGDSIDFGAGTRSRRFCGLPFAAAGRLCHPSGRCAAAREAGGPARLAPDRGAHFRSEGSPMRPGARRAGPPASRAAAHRPEGW